jgi:hypothetical protein
MIFSVWPLRASRHLTLGERHAPLQQNNATIGTVDLRN